MKDCVKVHFRCSLPSTAVSGDAVKYVHICTISLSAYFSERQCRSIFFLSSLKPTWRRCGSIPSKSAILAPDVAHSFVEQFGANGAATPSRVIWASYAMWQRIQGVARPPCTSE